MWIIELSGMEFYSFHGCFKEEQVVGNKFLVDLSIEADCNKASESDNVHDAINYQTAYKIVKQEMDKKSHLLENIAKRIIENLFLHLPGISKATVKVTKLNPPVGGRVEKVSVVFSK